MAVFDLCKECIRSLSYSFLKAATFLRHPFLLFIRLYWGWQFFEAGKGKFGDINKVIGFFTDLGIPFPSINAWVVASTECFGGLLLILGLCSRLACVPLTIAMTVAYLAGDFPAVKAIFSEPDIFVKAAPFPFLMTSLVVLIFGPGALSIDKLLGRFCKSCQTHTRTLYHHLPGSNEHGALSTREEKWGEKSEENDKGCRHRGSSRRVVPRFTPALCSRCKGPGQGCRCEVLRRQRLQGQGCLRKRRKFLQREKRLQGQGLDDDEVGEGVHGQGWKSRR